MTTTTLDPIRALSVSPSPATSPLGRPTSAPRVSATGDQHVLIQDPPAGTTVEMSVGRQLALRFRPRVGASRWRVVEHPDHLVPLVTGDHELCFLVFDCEGPAAPQPLRLERADPAGGRVLETRDLVVVPRGGGVNVDGARTPRSASPRNA